MSPLDRPPARILLPAAALETISHHLGNGGMAAGGMVGLVLRHHRDALTPRATVLLRAASTALERIALVARALTEDTRCKDCPRLLKEVER